MTPLEKLDELKKELFPAQEIIKKLHKEYGITFTLIRGKDEFPEGQLGMNIELDVLEKSQRSV